MARKVYRLTLEGAIEALRREGTPNEGRYRAWMVQKALLDGPKTLREVSIYPRMGVESELELKVYLNNMIYNGLAELVEDD